MVVCTVLSNGCSSALQSMNSSPRLVDRERLWPLPPDPVIEPCCAVRGPELILRATMPSRIDLKSSRKMVSDAHLNTSANRQYGLMPLLAVTRAALTATSVSRKTIDKNMQSNMIPKRVLILTSAMMLYPYVFLIASMSLYVVKIHHGSRTKASQGLMRTLASDPRELKYEKFDQASATQNGCTQSSEMMKRRDPHRGRKGRILSQETTLCRKYDIKRSVAVAERYQP